MMDELHKLISPERLGPLLRAAGIVVVGLVLARFAGRAMAGLVSRHNLMEELGKIRRTIAKQDESAPHLTLLVVDATTGANALQQAKEFHKACPLDGLIVTKMDGSGKGGIAVTIHEQLGIRPRFLGLGEEPDAFAMFHRESFVKEIL